MIPTFTLTYRCGSPTCAAQVSVTLRGAWHLHRRAGEALARLHRWVHQHQDGELTARWYCPRCAE